MKKLCKDCVYVVEADYPKCSHPNNSDLITGAPHSSCETLRRFGDCNRSGYWFEPKDKSVVYEEEPIDRDAIKDYFTKKDSWFKKLLLWSGVLRRVER